VEVIRFEEAQVLSLKVYEELDLFGEIAHVLAVQTEVVVQGPQRRMEPGRSEEVVVDSLAVRKVVVDIVVLFKLGPKLFLYIIVLQTLFRIGSVVSLGVLLRRCSLGWIASTIALLTSILVRRLSLCHRCIKKILIVTAGLDKSFIELSKVVWRS
jgi:hypothetical protein